MKYFMVVFLTLFSLGAYAANLSLYETPDSKANVIATVKEGQAIMPIFKKGDWIKVADPSNGNVGWIQSETLQKSGFPQVSMQIATQKGDSKATQKMLEDMQKKQIAFQQSMDKLMEQNAKNFAAINREFNQVWTSATAAPQPPEPKKK